MDIQTDRHTLQRGPRSNLTRHDNTTTPVAGSWAGAVMIWAGAVMILVTACSNTNFLTLKMPKNAKIAKCDGRTQV